MNIEQYTEFYKKYRTYVTQLLTKRNYGTDIISDQDINDLVSEIFINIYNKVCVDKTLVMDEPKRYVSVAAKHAYIDLIRSFKGVRNMRSKMISLDSMTVPYNIDNSVGEEHLRILEEKENMFKANTTPSYPKQKAYKTLKDINDMLNQWLPLKRFLQLCFKSIDVANL